MLEYFKSILFKNSPCRSFQKMECQKFSLYGDCLEFGNFGLNKNSFFNDFKILKNTRFHFSDQKKLKKDNYFYINLEIKNNVKKKFDNIIIFNVLEHVYYFDNAINELKKLLKKGGKIYISTPFIFRYHQAPMDYFRFTLDFYDKISKNHKIKILYKNSLGFGPFSGAYSVIHNLLRYIYPFNIIISIVLFLLDKSLRLFSKKLHYIYPIANFVVFKTK